MIEFFTSSLRNWTFSYFYSLFFTNPSKALVPYTPPNTLRKRFILNLFLIIYLLNGTLRFIFTQKKEKESTAVFKNVANTIEEKPVPETPVVAESPVAPVEAKKVKAQTQAEPKVVQSSALPAELAEEAADLQKMTVAEEKISIAEEVKTLPKEEPLNFAKALKTPPVEKKIVEKVVEEEKKVENVKLDDLENEEEDSGNVSEEKSAEESLEKIQAISDECEKAVKRTSTEIEVSFQSFSNEINSFKGAC